MERRFSFGFQIISIKLILWPKMGLTCAISIVNWNFFTDFKLLMFHNNIVKISENLNKSKLLIRCIQIIYPIDLAYFSANFTMEKIGKSLKFLKTTE